jgi:hypothetical protein
VPSFVEIRFADDLAAAQFGIAPHIILPKIIGPL